MRCSRASQPHCELLTPYLISQCGTSAVFQRCATRCLANTYPLPSLPPLPSSHPAWHESRAREASLVRQAGAGSAEGTQLSASRRASRRARDTQPIACGRRAPATGTPRRSPVAPGRNPRVLVSDKITGAAQNPARGGAKAPPPQHLSRSLHRPASRLSHPSGSPAAPGVLGRPQPRHASAC